MAQREEHPQGNKKGFFAGLVEKYNRLCNELGVDQGACRSCVPVVKFDPEQPKGQEQKTDKD
ncbi:hypothetical protein EDC45_1070 [Mesocricetibacter intestinalis]|uniref:DUF5363 family protein n=1 Tax=Mesocricetibacter intestinalis TaxID=1521930 RepID=A0A4R6VCJ1_9PAST|nr:DUF5363 domain-containing protein [Mesocricetibacter intestinalis]TDQ58003.1 hypothetical protein EDC45_1070 [Mesocricetibacter intestinalis]